MGAALAMNGMFSSGSGRSNIWVFVAQPSQSSRDAGYHIDWLLRHFADRHHALQSLRERGCRVEVVCFWESISGNGGPTLDRALLVDLARFPLDRLGFDFRIDEPPWGSDPQSAPDSEPKSTVDPPAPGDEYSPVGGRTYATLRIYHHELSPQEIGSCLDLEPDRVVQRGAALALRRTAPLNGWFYGSDSRLGSSDVGLHLAWLTQALASRRPALQALQERGCRMDISCFWESAANASGPALSGDLLIALSMLPLDEIWFDVYFDDGNDSNEDSAITPPLH